MFWVLLLFQTKVRFFGNSVPKMSTTKGISNQFSFCVHYCQIPINPHHFSQSFCYLFHKSKDSNWSWSTQINCTSCWGLVARYLNCSLPNLIPVLVSFQGQQLSGNIDRAYLRVPEHTIFVFVTFVSFFRFWWFHAQLVKRFRFAELFFRWNWLHSVTHHVLIILFEKSDYISSMVS